MDPRVWGPRFWFSLHSVTFTYPFNPDIEHQERIKNFFNSLEYILPCSICRVNYSKNIRKLPIDNNLDNRKKLAFWLIDIHNMVNLETGKRSWSYQEVLEHYEKIYQTKIFLEDPNPNQVKQQTVNNQVVYLPMNKKCSKNNIWLIVLCIIVFIVLVLLLVFVINRKLKK
jgi:hypothetical protein